MVRTRPTIVLVMAILAIIFGSVSALSWLCLGGWTVFVHTVNLPQLAPVRESADLLKNEVPGYLAIEVSNQVLGLVLAVLLITAGIGLLRMKGWARWTSVICGAVIIITHIAHSVYQWVYINPVMTRWTEEKMAKLPPGAPNVAALFESPTLQAIAAGGALLFSIGFPIVLVVAMLLPNVGAAFARPKGNQDGPTKQG